MIPMVEIFHSPCGHDRSHHCLPSQDLKMVLDWPGPVGVKGMDAICKHEPPHCALHCHLGPIFVLFRQRSMTKPQRGKPPRTCLHEAVCLHKADSNSKLLQRGRTFQLTSVAVEKLGFEDAAAATDNWNTVLNDDHIRAQII